LAQVDGHRPEAADAIDTDADVSLTGNPHEPCQVIEDPGARLLMDAPHPAPLRLIGQGVLNLVQIPGLAPLPGERFWLQTQTSRLSGDPLAELAVDEHHAASGPRAGGKGRRDRF